MLFKDLSMIIEFTQQIIIYEDFNILNRHDNEINGYKHRKFIYEGEFHVAMFEYLREHGFNAEKIYNAEATHIYVNKNGTLCIGITYME